MAVVSWVIAIIIWISLTLWVIRLVGRALHFKRGLPPRQRWF
jgi:hypothetical protein